MSIVISLRNDENVKNINNLKNLFERDIDIDFYVKNNKIKQNIPIINSLLLYFYVEQRYGDIYNYANYIHGHFLTKYLKKYSILPDEEICDRQKFLIAYKKYIHNFKSVCDEIKYPFEFIVSPDIIDRKLDSIRFHLEKRSISDLIEDENYFSEYFWVTDLSIKELVQLFSILDHQAVDIIRNIFLEKTKSHQKHHYTSQSMLTIELNKFNSTINKYKNIANTNKFNF